MKPSPPRWSYLLNNNGCVKRQRIGHNQSDDWNRLSIHHMTGGTRNNSQSVSHRWNLRPRSSCISGRRANHALMNNESIILISDNSDNEVGSDKELDISVDESNSSDNCINDIIDEDADDLPPQDHVSPLFVSSDSDIEMEVPKPVSKSDQETTSPSKVDCFIAESGLDSQIMVTLELPSKKEIRTRLSSHLVTLLKRLQSEEVVWRHRHSKKSNATSARKSQTFTSSSIVLPSESLLPNEHVLINSTQNDVLVLQTTSFSSSQWELLRSANALKCSLLITLKQPWREIPLLDSGSNRLIFSSYGVDVQEIPLSPGAPATQRIAILCECVRRDPEGNSWSSCPHRFGNVASNQTSLDRLCTSKSTQLQVLVLSKSLLWFENRLRVAYLVKLSNKSLSIFLRPFHPLQFGKVVEIMAITDEVAPISPGCVYSVSSMPVRPVVSESGLGRKAQSLWQYLTNFLELDERLTDFTSPTVDIDAANDAPIFLLKNSDKLQFTLQLSAFSETDILVPYSSSLPANSRCVLNGVLLHEFPSGSVIAEEFLTALKNTSSLQSTIIDTVISTLFVIYSENEELLLVLSTYDAVTPLALLSTSNVLEYGRHQSCRVKLSIVGAVLASRGFLILDGFSRIDFAEIEESSPNGDFCIYQLPVSSGDFRHKILSLVEISGTITGVDSPNSQIWPLCPGCLLDDLEQVAPSSVYSNSDTSILQCSRCRTKCGRPFRAVEVMVELTNAAQKGRNCKVSILPSFVAKMMKISEAQIYHSTSLNPRRLIGQSVNSLFGLLIKLSSLSKTNSDSPDFIIQLHPNMFA